MNYKLLTATMALAAIVMQTSCSTDDTASEQTGAAQQQLAIDFTNYFGRNVATRGTIQDETTVGTGGFGIYAMYTKGVKYDPTSSESTDKTTFEPEFMTNFKVTKEGDNWVYNPLRYWPNTSTEYLSFLAYAPYDANAVLVDKDGKKASDNGVGDRTFISYTLTSNKPDETKDLMYNSNGAYNLQLYLKDGATKYTKYDGTNESEVNGTDDNKVKLNFKHATSRLAFAITSSALKNEKNYVDDENTTESDPVITIEKFMLLGDNKSANSDKPAGAFFASGNLALDPAATTRWENKGGRSVYFSFNDTNAPSTYEGTFDSKWTPGAKGTASAKIKGTRTKGDNGYTYTVNTIGNSKEDYIFFIPGGVSVSTTTYGDNGQTSSIETGLYCYIKYNVTYTSMKENADGKTVEYEAYRKVSVGDNKGFEEGKAYLILVDIGVTGANGVTSFKPVELNAATTDWGDETETTLSIGTGSLQPGEDDGSGAD